MISMNRLKKEHFDKKSKLEEFLDFYECPVCFSLSETIMECPGCKAHVCLVCLVDYSKGEHTKNPKLKDEGIYKCTICHKLTKFTIMHKFLYNLLQELRFKCQDCTRIMPLKKLKEHKAKGECNKSLASSDKEEEVVGASFEPNAITGSDLNFIKSLFVFERDSKFIHEYVLQTKTLKKHTVESQNAFPHNSQSVQMPGGRLFLIGGGDFNKVAETMYECNEIFMDESSSYLLQKDKLKYPRHGHSACSLSDKFIIVTGSRKETDQA